MIDMIQARLEEFPLTKSESITARIHLAGKKDTGYNLKFRPLLPLLHLGLVLIYKYTTERLPSGRLGDLIEQTIIRSVKRQPKW
jgi:hypothetical protein